MGIYVLTKRSNRKLRLINVSQRAKEVFSITRLAPLFEGDEEMPGMPHRLDGKTPIKVGTAARSGVFF